MAWFHRKKRSASNDLTDLLLNDKLDQMLNVDTMIVRGYSQKRNLIG